MPSAAELYTRNAEVGRVVLVQYGPERGKLATIVDILDHNRALIDGPESLTGLRRTTINFKWLALTDLKVAVSRNARQKTLAAAWVKAEVQAKWDSSAWAKKIAAKATKAGETDLGRFQAKLKKQGEMKRVRAKLSVA